MIKIDIFNEKNCPVEIKLHGHANYAKSGNDIVCAGVSSIMNTLIEGAKLVLGVDIVEKCLSKSGELAVQIPQNISSEINDELQTLFKVAVCGLKSMENEYEKFIEIKES